MVAGGLGASTRERILDAALELFADEGVTGTTITAIERRAGLSAGSGSLYRHFRSKDDVLDATLRREIDRLKRLTEEERAALPRLPDRRSQLTLEFHQCLRDIRRFERLLRIVQRSPQGASRAREVVAHMIGLDRDVESWTTTTADPGGLSPMVALTVITALVGYHRLGLVRHDLYGVSTDQFIEHLVDLVDDAGKERAG